MFKYSKGKKKSSKENAVDASKVISEMKQPASKSDEIETVLSIPDDWNITEEEQYVYAFHNSESPKLKLNQVSIYGMELLKKGDNHVVITGLIRSSVVQPILFEKTSILLLDKDGTFLAKREFDLGDWVSCRPIARARGNSNFSLLILQKKKLLRLKTAGRLHLN